MRTPPSIFVDIPVGSVLSLVHGDVSVITNAPPEEPPTAANDDPPYTYTTALLEVREMKSLIRRKQAEDIPFEQRLRLFKIWKTLLQLERKWLGKLYE